MRAWRHSRLYAAALHPVMRACVEDAPANAIVPFFMVSVLHSRCARTVLESGRGFFSAPRVTVP